jgi:PAS domain S-box-containing protein
MSVFVSDKERASRLSRLGGQLPELFRGWALPLLIFYVLLAVGRILYSLLQGRGIEDAVAVNEWIDFDVIVATIVTALIGRRQYTFRREARRANAAAGELQERVQGIYSAATDGIAVAELDGSLLEVNDAFARMMGYSREELVGGMKYFDLAPDDLVERTRQTAQKAIDTRGPVEYQKAFLRKNGTRLSASVTLFPLKSREGDLTSLAAIVRDITERDRTEALLREAEERWQLALRVNYDGIWDWDLKKKVFYYSPRWREMFGYNEMDDVSINAYNAYEFFHPDEHDLWEKLRDQMVSGDTPYFDSEFRHICKDGTFKWIRCRGLAIRNGESNRLERVIGLDTDISVRKRNEFESKAIDKVLRGVSETSDLDELLTLIHGALREVVYAENCYVALYDRNTDMLSIPFCVDKFDEAAPPAKLGRGLTAYVLRTGNPQLLSADAIRNLTDSGAVEVVGTMPAIWLGVPLRTPRGNVGVLVVQHYDDANAYDERDADFLDAIGHHIALVIDRKLSEVALRSSERQLRQAQRIANVGSWEWDIVAGKVTWSAELFEIFGLPQDPGESTYEKFLCVCHADDRERVEATVGTALKTLRFEAIDHRIVRPDGTVRFLHTNAEIVPDNDGKPAKLIGTSQDITDRKQVETRMRLQTVALESAANGVVITDGKGDIEWVNPAFTLLTGYELNEVVGKNTRFLQSGKTPLKLYKELWKTITNGKVWQGELINKAKDGHLYDEEMTITPVVSGDGSVEHFIAIKRDISERKSAEAALRLSEEQHRLLFESNPFPVYVYDTETLRFLAVNQATVEHYGYTRKELLTKLTLKDLRPEEDHDELVRRVAAVTPDRDTLAAPSRHKKKDGTVIHVEITSHVLNFGGRQAEIVLVNDITERKRAEKVLSESEARFRDLFDNAPVAYHELDSNGHIIRINHTEELLLGYTNDELRGRHVSEIVLESGSREVASAKLVGNQELTPVERTIIRKDGTLVPVLNEDRLIYDSGGEIIGIRSTLQNITALKEAEQQLKIFNQRLEQSNRELQDFAYVASHDLQEPLRKVQTFADRLGSKYSDRLDETGLDYLGRLSNAASRMQTLIQDLLSFSRVTTKAQPFAPVDLAQITRDVLSDLEVKIEETGAVIEMHGLPQIVADPLQMRQLMQNLIGNALKFRKDDVAPHITITATNGRSNMNGPIFTITIEDNGIGFDEKYIDKIFTVFQRLHGRTEYEGSGIGLAVCRKIVERHQGTITARSSPGSGSRFIFTLPGNRSNSEVNR